MRIRKILLLFIALALLAALAAYLTCFTVSNNEFVIITQFGRHVRTITEPGLYFKLPGFIQTLNRLDGRLDIFKNEPKQLMLSDKNPIIPTYFVCWKISNPELFFQGLKDVETAQGKIRDMIDSQLGSVLGGYNLGNLINVEPGEVKLDEIEEHVRTNTLEKAKLEYGIEIVGIGLRRLAYPAIVEKSIYNRMRAEREKEARKFRAEGREEADKIEAQTDQEIKQILAEAYRDAEIRKGDGDQESMRIYAEAYKQDPEFYEFLKSMEIYKQALQENATLILSTDSELFKHLNFVPGKSGADKGTPSSDQGVPSGSGEGRDG
jgi:membrane protease subunit HflC